MRGSTKNNFFLKGQAQKTKIDGAKPLPVASRASDVSDLDLSYGGATVKTGGPRGPGEMATAFPQAKPQPTTGIDVVRREQRRLLTVTIVSAVGFFGLSLGGMSLATSDGALIAFVVALSLLVLTTFPLLIIFAFRLMRASGPGIFTEAAGFGGVATKLTRRQRGRLTLRLRKGTPEEVLHLLLAWAPRLPREERQAMVTAILNVPGARHEIMRMQARRPKTPLVAIVGIVLMVLVVAALFVSLALELELAPLLSPLNTFLIFGLIMPWAAITMAEQLRAWGELVARLRAKAEAASFEAARRIRHSA